MGTVTKIEWCDHSASPWYGCAHAELPGGGAHPGCENCYAEALSKRNPATLGVWGTDGRRVLSKSFHDNCRKWNAAAAKAGVRQSVFPSLCDPFEDWQGSVHDHRGQLLMHSARGCGSGNCYVKGCGYDQPGDRPFSMNDCRADLFRTIDACPWLDFLLLTKRPQNIRKMWLTSGTAEVDSRDEPAVASRMYQIPAARRAGLMWYRPNVQLLYSASDQKSLDAGIGDLLKCRDLVPVLGLSLEPLVGPVSLSRYLQIGRCKSRGPAPEFYRCGLPAGHGDSHPHTALIPTGSPWFGLRELDWVIVGGESGHNARPMHPNWARSLRDQCQAAGVPFFFKQWGEFGPCPPTHALSDQAITVGGGTNCGYHCDEENGHVDCGNAYMIRVGKKSAGRELDGRTWDEFPEVTR